MKILFQIENLIFLKKKITDELIILSNDKLNKEILQQKYEKELKTDLEIHKENMKKDEEKIKRYYNRRRTNNNYLNTILIILVSIILTLTIILIYLLIEK